MFRCSEAFVWHIRDSRSSWENGWVPRWSICCCCWSAGEERGLPEVNWSGVCTEQTKMTVSPAIPCAPWSSGCAEASRNPGFRRENTFLPGADVIHGITSHWRQNWMWRYFRNWLRLPLKKLIRCAEWSFWRLHAEPTVEILCRIWFRMSGSEKPAGVSGNYTWGHWGNWRVS